jgi:hypothetical protein
MAALRMAGVLDVTRETEAATRAFATASELLSRHLVRDAEAHAAEAELRIGE